MERSFTRVAVVSARHLLPLLLAVMPSRCFGQEVEIGGFLKSSYYHDTRQVVGVREGDFLLYPAPQDTAGANETDNLLFLPFFSRVTLSIGDLPEAWNAKVTGLIETDFYGASNATLNSVRMRRGFVKLDWSTHELLFGMDWSPSFIQTWPLTVATEAGAPFQPFARFPQVRATYKPNALRVTGIAAQQRDAFAEIGGVKAQQQSGLPMLMGFLEWSKPELLIGAGAWTKWIRPTLTSDRFQAHAAQGYLRWSPSGFAARAKLTYGEDLADHLMTGGYVTESDGTSTPLRTLAGWVDLETAGQPWILGCFAGYLSNEGAGVAIDPVNLTIAARNPEIEYAWRLAPRVAYDVGSVRFAWELQVTSAAYSGGFDAEYAPDPSTSDDAVTNVRNDFTVYLFF